MAVRNYGSRRDNHSGRRRNHALDGDPKGSFLYRSTSRCSMFVPMEQAAYSRRRYDASGPGRLYRPVRCLLLQR
jgi:hypothetical protein